MVNIPALQNILLSMASDLRFQLDNRDVLSTLKFIEKYTQSIVYEDDPDFESWADFLFMDNKTPEVLSQLYNDPALADGKLQPHQAFLLSMLAMTEVNQTLFNYYPYAHRNLYYRNLLGLKERQAKASKVAVAFNLSDDVEELLIPKGTRLSAGQDDAGHKLEFSLNDDLFANQSRWSHLYWCYPKAEGGAYSSVVMDEEKEWPKEGGRLFDEKVERETVLTGRAIISESLYNEDKDAMTVVVVLESSVEGEKLTAEISGDNGWIPLSNTTDPTDPSMSLVFRLESGQKVATGDKVELPYSVPVLRLSRQDGVSLGAIQSLTVNDVPATHFQQSVLTPFGVATHEQAVKDMQLYVGIQEMQKGQTLSLFWNINSPQMLGTTWEYLNAKGEWTPLDADLVDRTKGLSSQGEWSVVLPDEASNETTVMPQGTYWVRACIEPIDFVSEAYVYPWLSGLLMNAMSASLMDVAAVSDSFFLAPLSPETISKTVNLIEGVKGATQPWPSWEGQARESSLTFFARVQKQLSHRQRALTWPDMVTMLKTEFPYVWEALTPSEVRLMQVPASQEQALIVLPKMGEQDNDDRLRPVFNAEKLVLMTHYLQAHASKWQTIRVMNPTYRTVSIAYRVMFQDEVNQNYAEKQLRDYIANYCMPWVSGESELSVANTLNYYDIVAHIQRHTFVKHVHSLTLDGSEKSVQGKEDEVLIIQWAS